MRRLSLLLCIVGVIIGVIALAVTQFFFVPYYYVCTLAIFVCAVIGVAAGIIISMNKKRRAIKVISVILAELILVSAACVGYYFSTTFNFVANPESPYAVEAKVDAGKETESTLKAYQIPVGEYKVTNKTDAAAEINVYSGIIRETEDGTIVLHDSKKELVSTIKVGAAKYETVKIEKNQFVEAAEGTELFFETK